MRKADALLGQHSRPPVKRAKTIGRVTTEPIPDRFRAVPLSKRVAHFNRRVTNRFTRHFASWLPGFAIVTHIGRSSGRLYHTPVNVFRRDGRYVFALTYGRESDWVRNVLAAGGCEIEVRRQRVALTDPEVFTDLTRRYVPRPARWILSALDVEDFLAMTSARSEAATPRDLAV